MEVGRKRGDGLGRRPKHPAQDAAGNEDAAMDRRASRRVGKTCHQVGMRKHAGALLLIESNLLKRCIRSQIGAVESAPAGRSSRRNVGAQKLAEIGRLAADHIVEKQVERSPQVGRDRLVELGKLLGVLDDVGSLIDLEPLQKKVAKLRAGARSVTMRSAWRTTCSRVASWPAAAASSRGWSGKESQSPNESRDATS